MARALATAGLTKSKDRLGKLFLTTKIAKPPAGSTPAQAAEAVRRQIDADFAVLGVDQVDMPTRSSDSSNSRMRGSTSR